MGRSEVCSPKSKCLNGFYIGDFDMSGFIFRKQERKIRGMLVDHRKRAERRQDFYEQIVSDSIVTNVIIHP